MPAADPPPPAEDASSEDESGAADGGSTRSHARRRVLIGRFRVHSPLPAVEIAGEPAAISAPAEPLPEIPAKPAPVFDGVLAIAVLVLAAFLGSFAAVNADAWLDLAAGRLVARGQFPFGSDPFIAVPAAWINPAWLYDLLAYLVYEPGGTSLVAFKAGLVVALAAILLCIRRPNGGGLGPAAATTLVLLAVSPLLLLRPAVVSYLLFAVLLLILHRRLGPKGRWQLPLAVGLLFAIWVNLDDGFLFGLILLAVWTLGAVAQRAFAFGEAADDPGEAPHPPRVLAAALLAALFGCLLNPYHVRVFRLPAEPDHSRITGRRASGPAGRAFLPRPLLCRAV